MCLQPLEQTTLSAIVSYLASHMHTDIFLILTWHGPEINTTAIVVRKGLHLNDRLNF